MYYTDGASGASGLNHVKPSGFNYDSGIIKGRSDNVDKDEGAFMANNNTDKHSIPFLKATEERPGGIFT